MLKAKLKQVDKYIYEYPVEALMQVPARIFADQDILADLEDKVIHQLVNVASLPGIVGAALAMPDVHSGYGFPIGGVAAFDPGAGGIISGGGVGFDIACGVRTLRTPLSLKDLKAREELLADELFRTIPAGVGSRGKLKLSLKEMDKLLSEGASWAVKKGFGVEEDLEFIEEKGVAQGARPDFVSAKAKQRQEAEMGTLGSGNHYLEVQVVKEIYDVKKAQLMGLSLNQVVVSIHCGSRGLGHQIGTDYMREMVLAAKKSGYFLADRELAFAPIYSKLGEQYLGAMRAGINCALANRQIITHWVREVFKRIFGSEVLPLLYDVSHNTCREEVHEVKGKKRVLFVHRKGATRAFGPGHPELPLKYRPIGQPVLIGGSMGTSSYVLVGTKKGMELSFGSACHGAGRVMSRNQAKKSFSGRELIASLAQKGIVIRGHSWRGLAEEAPLAYKDVTRVVEVCAQVGLVEKVARLEPVVVVKG